MMPGFQAGLATNPAGMTAPNPTDSSTAGPGLAPVPGMIVNQLRNPPGRTCSEAGR